MKRDRAGAAGVDRVVATVGDAKMWLPAPDRNILDVCLLIYVVP
jgi:hypothetical protein